MDNLEQTETGKEPVEVTPKEEPTETTPKPEEVISGETDKEKEFQERLSKLQSTKNGEIAEVIKRADKAEREAKANLESFQKLGKDLETLRDKRFELQALLDEKEAMLTDDPDTSRKVRAQMRETERKLEEVEKKQKEEKADLDRREYEAYQWSMSRKAEALQAQYGVPMEDLYKATDEKDMELIAYKFALTKKEKPEEKPESKEETPEFDAGVSSGSGGRRSFTRQQINDMSIEEYEKLKPEIDAAFRASRIK